MKHKMKVKQFDVDKFQAIAHVIGEYNMLSRENVETAKIQAFCGVSKPTALKYLNLMQTLGYVVMTKRVWRSNAYAYGWALSPKAARAYERGEYRNSYQFYHALILQIASNPKRGTVSI